MNTNTQIIILAAGHGKRMQSELPKALTPLKGKPFIKHVLEKVFDSNVCQDPVIVIGQKGDQVKGVLGDKFIYAIQDKQLGTGHAVMSAKDFTKNKENILVLYADQPLISSETIKKLIETHNNGKAIITMATAILPDFNDWRGGFMNFGRIIRDKNRNIKKIVEAKDASEEEKMVKEINPAYFCFKAEWMWKHLDKIKNNNSQGEYYLTDLIGMAFDKGEKIETIQISPKEALGVNTKEQLEILENII